MLCPVMRGHKHLNDSAGLGRVLFVNGDRRRGNSEKCLVHSVNQSFFGLEGSEQKQAGAGFARQAVRK